MPNNDISIKSNCFDGQDSTYISSSNTLNTENYSSSQFNAHSSSVSTTEASATSNYSSKNGYGLIDASKSVSQAAGQNPYNEVADTGGNNWGLDMIKAPEVWQNGHTGSGTVVAVIDTGVDYNHEDLKNNIWTNTKEIPGNGIDDDGNGYVDDVRGWNFNGNNNETYDDNGHGTHVSGIIAGENNGYGVTGVAYNAKIMPIKVLNSSGSGSYSAIANGIYYAVDNGANVINLSLGGDFSSQTLKSAIEYASSKGVIVVMASGNDGGSAPGYPARYAKNSGIAVGAVNQAGNLTDFSNRAGSNELAYVTAPGQSVYSTLPGNQYASYSGTSMASPYVAGVVALMLSANPNLTESQIRQIITGTAGNSNNSNNNNSSTPNSGFDLSPMLDEFFKNFPSNSPFNQTPDFSFPSLSEVNTVSVMSHNQITASPKAESTFQYYGDGSMNSLANSPTDINNGMDIDFGQLIKEITRQLDNYRKLLG
ncbi:peptidase S8 [Nostoc sp. CENA543]|uniref:S8 family peptidase n=1 Tax=Nostoc sp. CENA543 TaxID=1869241 RepID=UPI000CA2F4E0|nr:S8 family peptidase [Nostoc sp. CENA543]AUT03878.1 peptidase S8 [Nostoc sp. CENA543]